MDADDMIREAISEEIDEILSCPDPDPDGELDRLSNMLRTSFWALWQERTASLSKCPECTYLLEEHEFTVYDGERMCKPCAHTMAISWGSA